MDQKDKHAARKAVKYQLKTNRMFRQPCEVCGSRAAEAHHPDYTLRLWVRWLCRRHHAAAHRASGMVGPLGLSKEVERLYLEGDTFKQAMAAVALGLEIVDS